jgi:hypothetical protein
VSSALAKLAAKVASFHQPVEGKKIAPRVATDTMRDLSRAPAPLNYALRGPHLQDPAVTRPPLLSTAADLDVFDQDTIGFALASLLRGRNAALAVIDAAAWRSIVP